MLAFYCDIIPVKDVRWTVGVSKIAWHNGFENQLFEVYPTQRCKDGWSLQGYVLQLIGGANEIKKK